MFERFGTERVPLGAYQAMSEEEHWRRVQTVIGSDGIVRPAPWKGPWPSFEDEP
jgi:hypothetical protein